MPGCAAIGCNNRSEKGYTMKCFPRNEKLRTIWTERVSRADWEPSNNSFLCHVHFEADQWTITQSGRIKLKKNAVPSIFTITSTRKSPRKRKKLENGREVEEEEDEEEEDLYIVEYLDDPTNHKLSSSVQSTTYNRYTTSNVTTLIGRPVCTSPSFRSEASEIVMQNNRKVDTIAKEEAKRANGIFGDCGVDEITNSSQIERNSCTESQMNSDQVVDDIEEQLRSICDGESQICEKTTMDSRETNKKGENVNGKSTLKNSSVEETTKFESTKKNGNSTKNPEIGGTEDTIDRKKRLRLDTKKDFENITETGNNSINGELRPDENMGKSCTEVTSNERRSVFTIKLTGTEEDVTEIIEGLGTEPILKYKSSNEFSSSGKNFVTSVISITDTVSLKSENQDEHSKVKNETKHLSSNDLKNENFENFNDDESKNTLKISMESPNDIEDKINYKNLKNKIKIQEEVIKSLTSQLETSKESETKINHMNTRSQAKRRKITQTTCNGECSCEGKDAFVNNLSSRLKEANESIKNLNKSLNEGKQNLKNSQLQIRQRDNRIKELNWKLNKASKYIERAEKNANAYRKKMISLQNMLAKKNIEARTTENYIFSKNTEDTIVRVNETTIHSNIDFDQVNNCQDKDYEDTNEQVICRTVQDIFEESSHCDDDPIIIDNPEDFMREFAFSL